jgi:hypothetical protein
VGPDGTGAGSAPIKWPNPERGPLEIVIAYADVDGRWEPVGVQVVATDLSPITAVALRSLPWGRISSEARPGPMRIQYSSPDEIGGEPLTWGHDYGFSKPRRGRPPEYGPEHFAEVARVYREAYADNKAPTRAVARHFSVSHSAAGKWVARCRDLGLLPPTTRGKARVIPQKNQPSKARRSKR